MNYRSPKRGAGRSKLKDQSSREDQSSKRKSGVIALEEDALADWDASSDGILRDGPPSEEAKHAWDLEERTAVFGERLVRFSKRIPRDPTNNRLIDQLVGAGTSVGANYCEANQSVSVKDFKFSISRCVKEAKETKFFLRMVAAAQPDLAGDARPLYREAHELLCIFGSMRRR